MPRAWLHGGDLSERLRAGAPREEIFRLFFQELRHPRPPALVVIEDVHWADEATLDLLKFLGSGCATGRQETAIRDRPLHRGLKACDPALVSRSVVQRTLRQTGAIKSPGILR